MHLLIAAGSILSDFCGIGPGIAGNQVVSNETMRDSSGPGEGLSRGAVISAAAPTRSRWPHSDPLHRPLCRA